MKILTSLSKWILLPALLIAAYSSNAQCPTITCPANIVVNNDPGSCGAVVSFSAPTGNNPCGMISDTFLYTGAIQTFTVPAGVTTVTIVAAGAQGGSVTTTCAATGGRGARMSGDVAVTPGEVLSILVGQQGLTNGSDAGGGGGTFVVRAGNVPLVVAGGGGGATINIGTCGSNRDGLDASITTSGTASGNGMVAGGTAGNGGGASTGSGGGGGGFYTDGVAGTGLANNNGKAYVNGGIGGTGNNNDFGGYGGGGAGWFTGGNGGGGGGYSGGGTSGTQPFTGGGGGGSYNIGTNQVNTEGAQTGNGIAIISYTDPGVISQIAGLTSGSFFPGGTTTQTFIITDYLNNTDTCTFTVTVNDNEDPVPVVLNLPVLTDQCSLTATPPTATDNCGWIITATTSDSLTYDTQGNYTIHWVYDDGNGNLVYSDQDVIIEDTTAPAFTCPSDLDECDGYSSISIAPSGVSDNCGGTVIVTYHLSGATIATGSNDASAEPFNTGTTTVTYVFDDGNGNADSCNFTVTIDPLPAVSFSGLDSFYCDYYAADTLSGMPAGGIFSGPGISGIVFDPGTAGTGTHNILYSYTDGNGCENTESLSVVVDQCAGIRTDQAVSVVSVYPNPSDGSFTIQLSEAAGIEIHNSLGGLVFTQQLEPGNHMVRLSQAKGLYFMRVFSEKGVQKLSLIVE